LKTTIQSHDFRTTKITELIYVDKLDINVVKNYVGHTNIATTLGYVKMDKRKAMEVVKALSLGKRAKHEVVSD
jgi:integrase